MLTRGDNILVEMHDSVLYNNITRGQAHATATVGARQAHATATVGARQAHALAPYGQNAILPIRIRETNHVQRKTTQTE